MSLRILYTRSASVLRSSVRNAFRPVRGMASGSHAPPKSDTPWMIGSAVVFGPALIWLLGPGSAHTVTGDAHSDPHPTGHGSAPAPIMQKIAPEAEIKNPDEEVKSSQESDEAKGQPRSNISAGEHAQGDAPRKEPANNAPAVKLDDPDNHGEKPESEKSGSGNAAKSESQEKKSQGEPTGSLNKEQKGTSGGDTADGGEPTKAEINESIGKEMEADAPKTAKKAEEQGTK